MPPDSISQSTSQHNLATEDLYPLFFLSLLGLVHNPTIFIPIHAVIFSVAQFLWLCSPNKVQLLTNFASNEKRLRTFPSIAALHKSLRTLSPFNLSRVSPRVLLQTLFVAKYYRISQQEDNDNPSLPLFQST